MQPAQRLLGVGFAVTALAACGARKGIDQTTVEPLLQRFSREPVFWRQFEVAQELATHREPRVLVALEPSLSHDDRHVRANAAYVFARRGDPRGLATIKGILVDRSDRPLTTEGPMGLSRSGQSRALMERQIRQDRYYAVHMLGKLRDSRGVDVLLPLLEDPDVNYHAAWALGLIGDARAVAPLIRMLDDSDAFLRISAIRALEALGATEAVLKLKELVNDPALPRAGDLVPVGEVAKGAIHRLTKDPWHTERFVPANGIKLHVLDWGGSGPNLVLLTGLGDAAYTFDSIALHFLKRFRVVALTRRGVLPSNQPGTGYDKATLTADVVQVLDRLQIRTAHLVGHSLGGVEVTEIASRFPERVLSVVYLDAAVDAADAARVMKLDPFGRAAAQRRESCRPDRSLVGHLLTGLWSPAVTSPGLLRPPESSSVCTARRLGGAAPTGGRVLDNRGTRTGRADGREVHAGGTPRRGGDAEGRQPSHLSGPGGRGGRADERVLRPDPREPAGRMSNRLARRADAAETSA
jgi:pimeloyl-ACP methyl ester carboxylesterase